MKRLNLLDNLIQISGNKKPIPNYFDLVMISCKKWKDFNDEYILYFNRLGF